MSHTLCIQVATINFKYPRCMLTNIKMRLFLHGPNEERSHKLKQAATLDVGGPLPVDGLPRKIRYTLIARDLASDIA